MKYVVDLHVHTIASGHAYSTLMENAKAASEKGIKVLGCVEHGPKLPGSCSIEHYINLTAIPRELYGVKILNGCEANIMDDDGSIDLPMYIQQKLDILIAGFHDMCAPSGGIRKNTKAILNVMENPYVDIISHPGNPDFPIDAEAVVKKAKDKNILLEINNGSFTSRRGSKENCIKIAALCKEYGVSIILGSDSHFCTNIGNFSKALTILDAVQMPEKLIINTDETKIIKFLKDKGKLDDLILD